MSQAANTNIPTTPTRRSALQFSAAAIVAGLTAPVVASAATPGDDSGLIALCADFHRQQVVADATDDDDDDGLAAALDVRWGISDRIAKTVAHTKEGHKAKAKVAIFLLDENHGSGGSLGSGDLNFAYSVLLDMAGSAAV